MAMSLPGLVARRLDRLDDQFAGFLVALEVGREPALVADRWSRSPCLCSSFQRVEGLGAVAQRLGEVRRADGHDHELLEVDAVVGVLAAVEDVHHRHRQAHGADAAEIGVERQFRRCGRRARHRHRDAEDGVGARACPCSACRRASIISASISAWRAGSRPIKRGSDCLIDVGDGLEHALAAVARLVAVAKLHRLVLARRGAGRHGGGRDRSVVEAHANPDGRISPGIEDLERLNGCDFRHPCPLDLMPCAISRIASAAMSQINARL